MATLCERLLVDLRGSLDCNMDAMDVPDMTDLDETESVECVASTWKGDMIYIFVCKSPSEPKSYIMTHHGDGGRLVNVSGPWTSLTAAKKSIGRAPEGWSKE